MTMLGRLPNIKESILLGLVVGQSVNICYFSILVSFLYSIYFLDICNYPSFILCFFMHQFWKSMYMDDKSRFCFSSRALSVSASMPEIFGGLFLYTKVVG